MVWFILLVLLSFGLKRDEQEYLLFCLTIALISAGLIGGLLHNENIFNTLFWIIFLFLASFLLFNDLYTKLWFLIKNVRFK